MFTLPRPIRRARWHRRHPPGPPPAGTILCGGEAHTISWEWGRLHFHHHRAAALAFGDALGSDPCSCAQVLTAIRTKQYYAVEIPGPVREALIAWDEELHERYLIRSVRPIRGTTALRERLRRAGIERWLRPIVADLTRSGLKVIPKVEVPGERTPIPTIQLCAPGSGATLGGYRHGRWTIEETAIEETARHADMPAWSRPSQRNTFCFSAQRCRLCQIPMTEATARAAHAESPEHRRRAVETLRRRLARAPSLLPRARPRRAARPVSDPPSDSTLGP
jgi:hypothetical protein